MPQLTLIGEIVTNPELNRHEDLEAIFDVLISGTAYLQINVYVGDDSDIELLYNVSDVTELLEFRKGIESVIDNDFFEVVIRYHNSGWSYYLGSNREWDLGLQLLTGIKDLNQIEMED